MAVAASVVCATLGASPARAGSQSAAARRDAYDLVLLGGRVIDPDSKLDAIRNVGIRRGSIATITTSAITGRDTIRAAGLVVAPGFIDLHQHAQDSVAYTVEARGGVTSAFELEEGPADIPAWYAAREHRAAINFGASVGLSAVRANVVHDSGDVPGHAVEYRAPSGAAASRPATSRELAEIERGIDAGLRDGAVAVGILLGDTPGATPWEVYEVFRIAARHGASVHVHLRSLPDSLLFLETEEVIAASAASGAPVQVVHVQSTGQEDTPAILAMLHGARARGVDVTTEMYPYTAAMTGIESAMFAEVARRPDTWFHRIEWPATGERLTRESFARYRALGGNVVIHPKDSAVAEGWVRAAVRDSLPMFASDGILHDGVGHPRVAGSYARIIGRYVREQHDLTLMDALRRMTLEPARRLERRVPLMSRKGRLRVGADADIVVFDPATIIDRATYREPTLKPAGVPHVLVGGTPVVRNGELVPGVTPGRAIRAPRAG